MIKCSKENCNNLPFQDLEECALHCSKGSYSQDRHSGLLSDFYDALKVYILNYFKENNYSYTNQIVLDSLSRFYEGDLNNKDLDLDLKNVLFIPTLVKFPARDGRDDYDYTKILNIFSRIHFNLCEISANYLELKEVKVFFQDCIFHDYWSLFDYSMLKNKNNVIYQSCTFQKDVSNASAEQDAEFFVLNSNQFDTFCKFNGKLEFYKTEFKGTLFYISSGRCLPDDKKNLDLLKIFDSKFNSRFVFNNFKVESVVIHNTIFEDKFEFKNNQINNLHLDNVDFLKLADFYQGFLKNPSFKRLKFYDLVVFENCVFDSEKNAPVQFIYTSFFDYSNFRFTSFLNGLDFEKANFNKEANFLKSEVNPKNTNKETFRIIKHNLDKSGNQIEANKYFALEMEAYKRELKEFNGKKQEKFLLAFNNFVSGHGQDFIKAGKLWLFLVALIALILANDSFQWVNTFYTGSGLLQCILDGLNRFALGFLPFSSFYEGREHLAFFILFSTFLLSAVSWQLLIALRRFSKR